MLFSLDFFTEFSYFWLQMKQKVLYLKVGQCAFQKPKQEVCAKAMYVHIGQDFLVPMRDIICIFDFDTATYSRHTKKLVNRLTREGRVIELYDDLPKAGVLCASPLGEHLYISQLSSATLLKRCESGLDAFSEVPL